MEKPELAVSAPGRICLFGEHQDYLGLPVIAAAINLRIHISGKRRRDLTCKIQLPDIDGSDELDLNREMAYVRKRDYLRSAITVLRRHEVPFPWGWDCVIRGTIPINSGTSSSSALVVAWIAFLLEAAEHRESKNAETIAEWAFQSEVAEFKEPGGRMDHYTSAFGGVMNIHFTEKLTFKRFKNPLKEFVLADSLIRKDTTGTLASIKNHVCDGVRRIQKQSKDFCLKTAIGEEEEEAIKGLPSDIRRYVAGTLKTKVITSQGESLFQTEPFAHERFGELLNRQQDVLREYLRISTSKLDRMIETALDAGALGAKINGSGEGGCIFAYCPEKGERVAEALKALGTKVYRIHVDEGVKLESPLA